MRKLLIVLLLLGAAPGFAYAAEEGPVLQDAHSSLENMASVQRGAKYFVNYCMGCHSLQYQRYKRTAADLRIPPDLATKYLVFGTGVKLTDMMDNAMSSSSAKGWFGVAPPDLSVIARQRGANWIYTYLKSFYLDPSRPTGANNLVLPNSAMPDVLWQLQGLQTASFKTVKNENGETVQQFEGFKQAAPGALTPEQFNGVARDITNFLVYVGEPSQLQRSDVGWAAIVFILVLIALTYVLKRDVWRDVHGKPHYHSEDDRLPPDADRDSLRSRESG
ncbi:MAG TPA: cytochrome c1 [Gammaproteobacteria bacterium]|nr:cytochrome c1 [Gammaproteobacteria bacterium]